MTDISSVKAHADSQPASVALYGGPPPPAFTNGSPYLDGTIEEEESSTIKCICGFPDDDGSTVLCEKCDTWQHIVCYYESTHHVPEVHECTDCSPRTVDAKGAAEKQRQRREQLNIGERKGKPKTATKSHKKRVKDPLGSVQPNGWAVHANNDLHYASERKSGSPRDQPPPSKRPKTSHRTSGSVGIISQSPAFAPASRKRASSSMFNGQSPVKSPTNPGINGFTVEDFSPEFMNLYRQPEPPSIDSNSFTDIGVANDISLWLNDREALAQATDGMEPSQIFQRIEQTIEDLESMAPVITKQTDEDSGILAHGLNPQWQYLTVETMVPNGGYIGELKGHIGRKADYFSDPSNRWDLLQHPEPFVFFPPHLPIYVDARREGTILRYTRRSCNPNMIMKIFTHSHEGGYHFCFVATDDIHPGEELTVGWEINAEIKKRLINAVTNGDIRKEGFKKIEPWVACVLANFGGCACDPSKGRECLLERARRPNNNHAEPLQPPKSTKSRKLKKSQISPLSTGHATNSRAGSEAFNRDGVEEENMDSRSTSGSRSKPGSRDITPMTHFSVDGGDVKMSDRERRKLQQQERLFEQLEYDEQHKGKRGKRNSAGSTLNTPGLSSSVRCSPQPSLFKTNADGQKQLGHSESSGRNPREHSNGIARKTSGNSTKANGCRQTPKPKPVYVDSSTQTEDDRTRTSTPISLSLTKKREMKPPMSFKRKLLQQAQEDRLQRERSRSIKTEAKSPVLGDVASNKPSPAPRPPSTPKDPSAMEISSEAPAERPAPQEDVEMKDTDEATSPKRTSPKVEEMPDAPALEPTSGTSHPPIQPPPPPWPSDPSTTAPPPPTAATTNASTSALPPATLPAPPQKPTNLHLELPPTPDLSNQTSSVYSVVTPGSVSSVVTGGGIAQSPISVAPVPSPFSPSVTNAVNPGPARKKLSLSDYTSRKKLAQTQSAVGISASPPLANVHSASSPTISNASLPDKTSPSAKSTDANTLPTVTEEVKTTSAG
ncbi:hypothetical protein K469DRAFT_672513 [Zopfia rhizophila CBS 207.26]|uniref:SET domain-containing protein n=1 Tax=Zopfia rhizophila CBS 207.26 TaxID=1314779 RepID=A0A6A6DNF6_9PEZI|nr:hypothetical protein K469DRAFT_672513 [Zopfia rhizophila CBS 207.26]